MQCVHSSESALDGRGPWGRDSKVRCAKLSALPRAGDLRKAVPNPCAAAIWQWVPGKRCCVPGPVFEPRGVSGMGDPGRRAPRE